MGYIVWTDNLVSGDNHTAQHIINMKNDITSVINGNITGANISPSAAIPESKITFDPVAGHDHDGVSSHVVAGGSTLRADITGMMPKILGADTVRVESGALELNGVVYTRNAYSSTIDLDTNADWVEGAEQSAPNITFYVYAYNDAGTTWDIKFWMQAPQYANCGTDTDGVLLFRQTGGVWYRCIAIGLTDGAEDISSLVPVGGAGGSTTGSGAGSAFFQFFGGNGEDGAASVSADTNFSSIDSSVAGIAQYTSLTVVAGKTLTIDTSFAWIGVSGTCTIHGTIEVTAVAKSVWTALNTSTDTTPCKLGGGGGGSNNPGETAGGLGGTGVSPGGDGAKITATLAGFRTGGLGDNSTHIKMFDKHMVKYGGGAGGEETWHNHISKGGGVLYIECGTLIFDGTINAKGEDAYIDAGHGGSKLYSGGAGGGVVIIRANAVSSSTGTINVSGGAKGVDIGVGESGAGGEGFKDIVVVG